MRDRSIEPVVQLCRLGLESGNLRFRLPRKPGA